MDKRIYYLVEKYKFKVSKLKEEFGAIKDKTIKEDLNIQIKIYTEIINELQEEIDKYEGK